MFEIRCIWHLVVLMFVILQKCCSHVFELDEELLAKWDQHSLKKVPNSLLDSCNCTSNVKKLLQKIRTVNFVNGLVKARKIVIEGDTCDCFVADDEMSVGKIVFAKALYEDFGADFDENEDNMLEFSNNDSL